MELEKIIEVAKTKECWSRNREYNYGPIEYFRDKIVSSYILKENFSAETFENLLETYEKNVHLVTDWKTLLAHEYIKFDVRVNVTQLICTMSRTFPEVDQRRILLHIGNLIAEDKNKVPFLDHCVLKESIRDLGMTTNELLGIELS